MDKQKARALLAVTRIRAEANACKAETGLEVQFYADSDGVGYFNLYDPAEGDAQRMPSLPEALHLMQAFVSQVEAKGQLKKPEQLGFAVKFKRLLTKYKGE